ncbi:hypothetical protein [Corynebacterium hindlerae]|uniref:hypothetical protein n=1 Tax=Corynebacterium hindlerae TaxID=699041 RepID=UPI003AABC61A
MFLNVLNAEFTKLRTTKAFWGNAIVYAAMTVGIIVLVATIMRSTRGDGPGPTLVPHDLAQVVNLAGGLVLAIMSILVVTSEYGQKLVSVTFQATPNRLVVALAKLLLMILVATVFTVVTLVIVIPLARMIVGSELGPELLLSNSEAQKYLWKTPVYATMFIILAQGLAWIVRSAVFSIMIILPWFMVVEVVVVPMIPKFGEKVLPYLPFKNLSAFYYAEAIEEAPWGYWGSLWYFAAIALVVYVVGVALLVRRDA